MGARDRSDLDEARAALALHRARFPEGILAPERARLSAELDALASPEVVASPELVASPEVVAPPEPVEEPAVSP